MNKIAEQFKKYKEIIMYLIVGVITTVFSWITYAIFIRFMPMIVANALSWFVTVLFAYITNKVFVFESRSWKLMLVIREGLAFFGSRAATGVFEVLFQPALYAVGVRQSLFGVKGFVAKIITSAVVMVLNYVCSKLFVFREKKN